MFYVFCYFCPCSWMRKYVFWQYFLTFEGYWGRKWHSMSKRFTCGRGALVEDFWFTFSLKHVCCFFEVCGFRKGFGFNYFLDIWRKWPKLIRSSKSGHSQTGHPISLSTEGQKTTWSRGYILPTLKIRKSLTRRPQWKWSCFWRHPLKAISMCFFTNNCTARYATVA